MLSIQIPNIAIQRVENGWVVLWERKLTDEERKKTSEQYQKDEEKIEKIAYRLWERAGWPQGRDQEFWFEAERRIAAFRYRRTRIAMDDALDVAHQCTVFTETPDGFLRSDDPMVESWLADLGEVNQMEKNFTFKITEEQRTEFYKKFNAAVIKMAEGDWLASCGLPYNNGLMIQLANAPIKHDPLSQLQHKFRNLYYEIVGDKGGLEADSDRTLNAYKIMAEAADKVSDDKRPAWDKDVRVKVGRHLIARGSIEGCSIKRKTHWRNEKRGTLLTIYNIMTPERMFVLHELIKFDRSYRGLQVFINTVHVAKQYKKAQEERALSKLRGMISEEAYERYLIAGVIEEVSTKSGVTYFVRKMKPTIAFRYRETGRHRGFEFLAGLCLHPMAYYLDSFGGCLCPTDDVMSHLLYIRGDEHGFWGKANHHGRYEVEAGIP
jgi:hypothetical protein